MATLLSYLLKVGIMQALFYSIYVLAFERMSFFGLNRAYLLLTLLIAFIIPLLTIPVAQDTGVTVLQLWNLEPGTFSDHDSEMVRSQTTAYTLGLEPGPILIPIYFLGMLALLFRSLVSINRILRMKKTGIRVERDGVTTIYVNGVEPFCFFGLVYLDPNYDKSPVLLHEKGHINYAHWIDLLILEVITIAFWFNPFVWCYKVAMRHQHEFQADDFVMRNGVSRIQYLQSIMSAISIEEPIGPINRFSSKSLKKRINMITKRKTAVGFKLLYLLLIPAACLALLAFSRKDSGKPNPLMLKSPVIVIDAAHGGSDQGSLSSNGMSEKNLSLEIAKLIRDKGQPRGLNVILNRSSDETLSLDERVRYAKKSNADIFVSLHFAYDEHTNLSGIECYVSKDNAQFTQSEKLGTVLLAGLQNQNNVSVNGIKNSPARVLTQNSVPAVILELGYLSNEGDAKFYSDPANQDLIAEKIITSLLLLK